MKDCPVIWIPGLDHAGIATQMVIEKYLSKTKNVTKFNIGKEEYLSFIWKWKNQKETEIKSQLKALGASLDWSKEYFTMNKVFHKKSLYKSYFKILRHKLFFYNTNFRIMKML